MAALATWCSWIESVRRPSARSKSTATASSPEGSSIHFSRWLCLSVRKWTQASTFTRFAVTCPQMRRTMHLIGPAEALGTDVDLEVGAGAVLADLLGETARQDAAAGGPGAGGRAERAGRLLDRDVHVGLAGPSDPHPAIPRHRGVHGRTEAFRFVQTLSRLQLAQRSLGHAKAPIPQGRLLARPGLTEDPDRGPLDPRQVVDLLGHAQAR